MQGKTSIVLEDVVLEDVVLQLCDLGLDVETGGNHEKNGWGGVTEFLECTPDPPDDRSISNAYAELQLLGALDHRGFVAHFDALHILMCAAPGEDHEPWRRRSHEADLLKSIKKVVGSSDAQTPFGTSTTQWMAELFIAG